MLDKHTRRKPAMRSSDFFMGGLKQESNTNKHLELLRKFTEKGAKKDAKEQEGKIPILILLTQNMRKLINLHIIPVKYVIII
jgi:hypothetical protein